MSTTRMIAITTSTVATVFQWIAINVIE